MPSVIESQIASITGDPKLARDLSESYNDLTTGFFAQDPVHLLRGLGVYIEAILRVDEHLILGFHTPLSEKINVDDTIKRLEKASGPEGLRIHAARLSRAAYDFRSRKKSIHLTSVDPQLIDANLLFEISTWTLIEVLKESGIPNAEATVKLLATRKIPLVERVDGILKTTKSSLSIPERIILLLYAQPDGLMPLELFESVKVKAGSMDRLRRDLGRLEEREHIHQCKDGRWILFGSGKVLAEKLLKS